MLFRSAETDCVFINVLATNIQNIDGLEREMVVDTFEEFENYLLEDRGHEQKSLK